MKKKLLLIPAVIFLAGAGLVTTYQVSNPVLVSAEEEQGKDMNGIYQWKAVDGNFVTIDNWFYSGKGFSYEFKLKDPTAANIKETIIILTSNGVDITAMKDLSTSNYRAHNFAKGKYSGEIGFMVPLGNDWYRYELMLADLNPFITATGSKTATIDGIKWNWASASGYYNDCYMKNMKVIDHYSPEAFTEAGDDGANHTFTVKAPTNNPGSQGGLSPTLNWKNSGRGISFEFEDGRTKHEIVYSMSGTPVGSTSAADIVKNKYMFKNGSIPQGQPGKLFSLGNNWYRYELMFKDAPSEAGMDEYTLNNISFVWGKEGYGASKYRCIRLIDAYTCDVTYNVGGTTELVTVQGKLVKPNDPTPTVDTKHFDGWYVEDTFVNKWDFDDIVEKDMTLYAKFADHSFEWTYDDEQHWQECECGKATAKEDHNLQEVMDDKYMKYPATCSHPATYYKSCTCGYISEETFIKGDLDPNNHVTGDVEIINFVEPTCTVDGGYDNVIKCQECHNIIEEKGHVTIPSIGHKYEADAWALSDDKTKGTVTFVCANDSNHKVTQDTAVSLQTIEATSEKEGLKIYTLTAAFEEKLYSHTITEVIPKKEPETPKGGCGGSIIATSALLSTISLLGASLLVYRKKKGE